MILQVAYDLNSPDREYEQLHEVIEQADSCFHAQKSLWLIDTAASVREWSQALRGAMDNNDLLFVTRVHVGEFHGFVAAGMNEWLQHTGRRW